MADKDITTGLTKTTVLTTGDYVYAVDGGNSRGILFENFIASIRTLNGSGADGTLVTGTAGTSGNLASWNVDGDAVDSGIAAANVLVDADIGVAVQAYDAQLADVAGLTPTDGNFIVGNGTNFVAESGATARTSIGLGNVENTALSTWAGSANVTTLGTISTGTWQATDVGVAYGGTGASTAADAKVNLAIHDLGPNAQTGTTYTLVLSDAGNTVTMSNASANTLTIPTNASVAFDVGTVVNVIMLGAGATTIAGATGVTLNGVSAGSGAINTQYQGVSLLKIATDTWVASGDIATVA